jgi:outer membrane protein assembly factor BamB
VNVRFMTALLFVALAVASAGGQQHWPQFRGPNAGVVADNPELPETWSASDNVAWKVAIPGLGWSSPVVWGDHVLLTAGINNRSS